MALHPDSWILRICDLTWQREFVAAVRDLERVEDPGPYRREAELLPENLPGTNVQKRTQLGTPVTRLYCLMSQERIHRQDE